MFTLGTSPPMRLPTAQAFPLMQSPNLMRRMSAQPLSNANNVTKVLLAQLAGSHKPPAQTWPQRTRFSCRTTTSHQEVTGMRPFMLSITSTRRSTKALCLRPLNKVPSIPTCHSPHLRIRKHTWMPSPLPTTSTIASPHTVTRAGGHNSVTLSKKASSFHSSNSEA